MGNLGATTAIELAKGKPAAIVLVGRTPSKLAEVVAEISRLDQSVKVFAVTLDLASFASIRAGVKEILENDAIPKVDVIINNAGEPTWAEQVGNSSLTLTQASWESHSRSR